MQQAGDRQDLTGLCGHAGKKARDLQNWLTVYGYWNQVHRTPMLPALGVGPWGAGLGFSTQGQGLWSALGTSISWLVDEELCRFS